MKSIPLIAIKDAVYHELFGFSDLDMADGWFNVLDKYDGHVFLEGGLYKVEVYEYDEYDTPVYTTSFKESLLSMFDED